MKKILFTLVIPIGMMMGSCVKDADLGPKISQENTVAYENLNTTSTLNVPVQEGKITVVTFAGDVICMTKTAMTIPVPKNALGTKASNNVEISYVDSADSKYVEALGDNNSVSSLWQTIAFEDTMTGDYDYNDLVLHLCSQMSTSKKGEQKLHIGMHPIAYGATKHFKLGFNIYYADKMVCEKVLVTDVKQDLFLDNNGKYCGVEGMINTINMNYYTNFFTKVVTLDAARVSFANVKVIWFIEIENGRKLYAVNNRYNFLDENKRPYGLIITNTGKDWELNGNKAENCASWFEYPREDVNISLCYPDAEMGGANSFDAWLAGAASEFNMRKPIVDKVFDIVGKEQGHFVYQIENGNEKNLEGNKYNKIRDYIELSDYKN